MFGCYLVFSVGNDTVSNISPQTFTLHKALLIILQFSWVRCRCEKCLRTFLLDCAGGQSQEVPGILVVGQTGRIEARKDDNISCIWGSMVLQISILLMHWQIELFDLFSKVTEYDHTLWICLRGIWICFQRNWIWTCPPTSALLCPNNQTTSVPREKSQIKWKWK